MFSIIIPTWNNLPYLELCIDSIKKYSFFKNEVVLHINDGSDGTLNWAEANGIKYTYTQLNSGVCIAVNSAFRLTKHEYIIFMNDDMFVLPVWDKILAEEIGRLGTDCFMLSSTMIEPYDTKNKCVIVADYGKSIGDFQEEKLLTEFSSLNKTDWSGSTWPPAVVHRKWWTKVGGYSEEFSPGMGSDDDFAMKMWNEGCRIYKGVAASRVYHFISKSTGRIQKNDGRKQFVKKWGIKQSTFHKYYTKRGRIYQGVAQEPNSLNLGLLFEKMVTKLFYN